MLQKGFLTRHSKLRSKDRGKNKLTGRLMFGGMLIIIASMIFLLANFYRADSMVSWWLPFLIAGVVLVYLGIFLKPGSYRSGR